MVKIRLKRVGAKKAPFYRIIVIDGRKPRDGRALAEIGIYQPLAKDEDKKLNIIAQSAQHWLNQGAQPTPIVKKLFKRAGVIKNQSNATGTVEQERVVNE